MKLREMIIRYNIMVIILNNYFTIKNLYLFLENYQVKIQM